jgi:protease-4
VWTGAQAVDHGLIDRVGAWKDALESARKRASLPEGAPVRYVEKPVGRWVRLLHSLGLDASVLMPRSVEATLVSGVLSEDLQGLMSEGQWLSDVMRGRKPYAAVVHCLCVAQP